MSAYVSPEQRHRALVAMFLREHERPCGHELDLREERQWLVCAECSRPYVRREVRR